MHIALFHQYHHNPDCPATCRHYVFMEQLAKRHRISLITSDAWEQKRLTQDYAWVPQGVELVSQKVPYSNKMNVWERLQAFGSFGVKALAAGLKLQKPDVVWGVTTPLTAAWAAAQVAKWHRSPWVFEVQDLWPSFPIQMGTIRNRLLQQQLYAFERRLYRQAAHVITLSPDMDAYVQRCGIPEDKRSMLYNGTDFSFLEQPQGPGVEALRSRYGIGNRKIILYAGTYGRANDIPTLIAAARELAQHPEYCFVFTGQGYYEEALKEAAAAAGNLILVPPQPRQHIFTWFSMAAVSLVSFLELPVLEANSPGKFFDSLAAGTPVVVTNAGWSRRFVEEHRCGWYVPAEQPRQLAATLQQLLAHEAGLEEAGRNGAAAARKHFDRQQMVPVLEQILQKVAGVK